MILFSQSRQDCFWKILQDIEIVEIFLQFYSPKLVKSVKHSFVNKMVTSKCRAYFRGEGHLPTLGNGLPPLDVQD